METQEVKHYQVNGKYRIVIERAASTKGILGYKVEANGDDIATVQADIQILKNAAEMLAPIPIGTTTIDDKKPT